MRPRGRGRARRKGAWRCLCFLLRRAVFALALGCLLVPAVASTASAKPRTRAATPPRRSAAPAHAAPAAPTSVAAGSAQRTFVSANHGNDANPCTVTSPCRNFAAAIAQTAPGGEVIVPDAGVGIEFDSGGALYVQQDTIKNFTAYGILVNPSTSAAVRVDDTTVTRSGTGLFLGSSTTGVTVKGTIVNSRFEDGFNGVDAWFNAEVSAQSSVATGNTSVGFYAEAGNLSVDNG